MPYETKLKFVLFCEKAVEQVVALWVEEGGVHAVAGKGNILFDTVDRQFHAVPLTIPIDCTAKLKFVLFGEETVEQVVALGVKESGIHAVAGKRNVLFDVVDQLFHVFPLGLPVGRTAALADREVFRVGGDVPFFQVDHGADKGELRAVQIDLRCAGGKPPLVEQGEKHRLDKVVRMVAQGDLVAARGERRGVQRAFAHFGAERTGIFLFSHVEHDFSDICLFQEKGDVQLRTEGGEGRKICGVILKIQIHRDRGQRERLGRKAAVRRQQL